MNDQKQQLWDLCQKFIAERKLSCGEAVADVDKWDCYSQHLIGGICEIVGYYEYPEDIDEKALYQKLKAKYEQPTVYKKYVPGKLLSTSSYAYKQLKNKHPKIDVFYEDYHEGGYLNTDYTVYYDGEGNKLHTEQHGNYS